MQNASSSAASMDEDTLLDAAIAENARAARLFAKVVDGDLEAVTALLKEGADPNEPGPGMAGSPLFMAAQDGHTAIVEALIRAGADVDVGVMADRLDNDRVAAACSPLWVAAAQCEYDALQALLAAGARFDVPGMVGLTPLAMACCNLQDVRTVALLLEHRADVNAHCDDGKAKGDCLSFAMHANNEELVDLLMRHGAASEFGMIVAASQGRAEVVVELADRGVSVNTIALAGEPPLWVAARNCHTVVAKKLIKLKADLNYQSQRNGNTALIEAATRNDGPTMHLLLEAGADWQPRNLKGQTALTVAFFETQGSVASVLSAILDRSGWEVFGENSLRLCEHVLDRYGRRTCSWCFKEPNVETRLFRCSRCRAARFCSEECLKNAWDCPKGGQRGHKVECALLVRVCEKRRELRAAAGNEDGESEASIDSE